MQMMSSPHLRKTLQITWRGHKLKKCCPQLLQALAFHPCFSPLEQHKLIVIIDIFYKENPRENSAQSRAEANATCMWALNSPKCGKWAAFHYRCHWSLYIDPDREDCLFTSKQNKHNYIQISKISLGNKPKRILALRIITCNNPNNSWQFKGQDKLQTSSSSV